MPDPGAAPCGDSLRDAEGTYVTDADADVVGNQQDA